jgi:hypothetical protein
MLLVVFSYVTPLLIWLLVAWLYKNTPIVFSGVPFGQHDTSSLLVTCANTACHGNFHLLVLKYKWSVVLQGTPLIARY